MERDHSIPGARGLFIAPSSVIAVIIPWGTNNTSVFAGIVVFSLALIAVFASGKHDRCGSSHASEWRGCSWRWADGICFTAFCTPFSHCFKRTRNPNRLVFLFSLALAILAAFGLDQLAHQPPDAVSPNCPQRAVCFGGLHRRTPASRSRVGADWAERFSGHAWSYCVSVRHGAFCGAKRRVFKPVRDCGGDGPGASLSWET